MSDTGRLTPPVIQPGKLKAKFIVPGAITGARVTEEHTSSAEAFRITEDGQFRQTEDQ